MRRSGRTFRYVMRALADASDGHKILYIAGTRPAVEYARAYAIDALHSLNDDVLIHKDRILFPSNGYIRFVTYETSERACFRMGCDKFDREIRDLT